MSLKVTIVSGPRRAGKTTVIECLVNEICEQAPHYIRLAAVNGSKKPPPDTTSRNGACQVATATWLNYDPQLSFETLPDVLTAVHKRDRQGCVIMEADTDPGLRHAYPYDCSVFVMPAPKHVYEVFRTKEEAQQALHNALNDTSAFAGEIYGLLDDEGSTTDGAADERPDMSDSQIITLMRTPLGQELASRIECRPDYHGVVESDVVVVNTGIGGTSLAVDEVVRRLERLGCRLRPGGGAGPTIFCCDPCDKNDPRRQKLLEHFATLYRQNE